jgi:uncharacterized lipoprotein YddW (UPF0748 family)
MSTKINTKLNWKAATILTVIAALAAISTTNAARSLGTKSILATISTANIARSLVTEFILTAIVPKQSKFAYSAPAPVTPKPQQRRTIGIYQGRFELTANASEREIRGRVRHYRASGFNTIVQGVWGNGCAMYASAATKKLTGIASCPNEFNPKAVEWAIDEAHKQGMQFHAYFETGIKIDKDSPIYDLAVRRNWLLSEDNSDRQHQRYILDVANPEVAEFYRSVVTEFVRKYPQVDAVQFDDYLSYSFELLDRKSPAEREKLVNNLTKFVNNLATATKQANPRVSFDICDFNDYWAAKYGADLANWRVDRRYIEAYRDEDFERELTNAEGLSGIAIGEYQLHRLPAALENSPMDVFMFPIRVKPTQAAAMFAQRDRVPRVARK